MDRIRKKIEKLKFRLLLLPADNHSGVPVTVIGFRKGMLYLATVVMVILLFSFLLFRFTSLNELVNVHSELSDEDKALITNLNKKVVTLVHEMKAIKAENERMKFFLTLKDTTISAKNDSLRNNTGKKPGNDQVAPKTTKDKKGYRK